MDGLWVWLNSEGKSSVSTFLCNGCARCVRQMQLELPAADERRPRGSRARTTPCSATAGVASASSELHGRAHSRQSPPSRSGPGPVPHPHGRAARPRTAGRTAAIDRCRRRAPEKRLPRPPHKTPALQETARLEVPLGMRYKVHFYSRLHLSASTLTDFLN